MDFSTLALEPGRFVDAKLSNRYSDLLFSAHIAGRVGFIYLLLEHLSSVEPLGMLRMLEYMVRIWRTYVRKHKLQQLRGGDVGVSSERHGIR
jgi:predicted transposase YdaD